MPNELEKVLAGLLKPKAPAGANENVEKLVTADDYMSMTDTVTVATNTPENRVGFALVGYSETS